MNIKKLKNLELNDIIEIENKKYKITYQDNFDGFRLGLVEVKKIPFTLKELRNFLNVRKYLIRYKEPNKKVIFYEIVEKNYEGILPKDFPVKKGSGFLHEEKLREISLTN